MSLVLQLLSSFCVSSSVTDCHIESSEIDSGLLRGQLDYTTLHYRHDGEAAKNTASSAIMDVLLES